MSEFIYIYIYHAYNSNRPNSQSGGVAILVNNDIKKGIQRVKISETTDAVAIKLKKNYFKLPYDLFIVSIYISPAYSSYTIANPDYTQSTFDSINKIVSRLSDIGQVLLRIIRIIRIIHFLHL